LIITRTPLRISIGGGGTDLPSYYQQHGGFVISAAINKYVYLALNRSLLPGYFLKYSETEHTLDIASIRHRLMREVLSEEKLHFTKQLGREIGSVLESGNVSGYGPLMHEHWLSKRNRSAGMSSNAIDELYELARTKGGATGGKLVGAGGSGFLLLQTSDRVRLRRLMQSAGLSEMDFSFDFEGSIVTLRNRG